MAEGPERDENEKRRWILASNRVLGFVDDIILILAAVGILGVAGMLMFEAVTDFIFYTQHSISHIISDLMFVLIVTELFRQVMRQLNRHTFSLNPFIFIGVVASIRGLLLTQMKLGLGEADWEGSVIQMGVHAGIVLVLVVALFFYMKCRPDRE
ncbi:MAG: phosphate-starvation-inducible PsiE family protein [Deltaproteobacteria bacterium]|nr:phosphate-starvation-inducible PsiE family protein [Deltaproteobacteria bacterium]